VQRRTVSLVLNFTSPYGTVLWYRVVTDVNPGDRLLCKPFRPAMRLAYEVAGSLFSALFVPFSVMFFSRRRSLRRSFRLMDIVVREAPPETKGIFSFQLGLSFIGCPVLPASMRAMEIYVCFRNCALSRRFHWVSDTAPYLY